MTKSPRFVGWRYTAFIGALVGTIGIACYPIIIDPMRNPEPWQKANRENRENAGIVTEKVQPGNMKVWTDPFDRK